VGVVAAWAAPSAARANALTPDTEKVRLTDQTMTRLSEVIREVVSKQDEARRTKDVIKLNCVSEKLAQIRGLVRVSEAARSALRRAVDGQDSPSADHEFAKVRIARQKVEQHRAEAEECIGQLAFRTDDALTVEVESPDAWGATDPTNPSGPPLVVNRPPVASPTR
jgi:hypothetical protein